LADREKNGLNSNYLIADNKHQRIEKSKRLF